MLDENETFGLKAPDPEHPNTIQFNVLVPDTKETFKKEMDEGCKVMQPLTELPDYGVSNAIFTDRFGYVWMLHQMHKEVSLEDRLELWEKEKEKSDKAN